MFDDKEDDGKSHGTEGNVDDEAPSPGAVAGVGECAAEERPTKLERPNMPVITPRNAGRRSSGAEWTSMSVDPGKRPAAPSPAMARPAIKTGEFGAAAHITDPISNTKMAVM